MLQDLGAWRLHALLCREGWRVNHKGSVPAQLTIRGHGKATQIIEAEIGVYDKLGLAEQQALLAALDALVGDEGAANPPLAGA